MLKYMNKIFIGTPCYGGMITADYFKSCLRLVNEAPKHNIQLQFGTIGNESLITRARNTLVQLFMDDPGKYTHLLFIDADIGFSERTVMRMLELDEEVVTGVYPRKTIDWTKVIRKVKEKPDIKEKTHNYSTVLYLSNTGGTKLFNPNPTSYIDDILISSEVGKIIFFPSNLLHSGINNQKGERIIISSNVEIYE